MSPVRFLEKTTLPAPIMATLIMLGPFGMIVSPTPTPRAPALRAGNSHRTADRLDPEGADMAEDQFAARDVSLERPDRQSRAAVWDAYKREHPPGTLVSGTVTRVEPFGVFVELGQRWEALLLAPYLSP